MARDKTIDRAAAYYAKAHNTTIHRTFESKRFRNLYNQFRDNPNDKKLRTRLGLSQRRLQSEAEMEEEEFAMMRRFGETPK